MLKQTGKKVFNATVAVALSAMLMVPMVAWGGNDLTGDVQLQEESEGAGAETADGDDSAAPAEPETNKNAFAPLAATKNKTGQSVDDGTYIIADASDKTGLSRLVGVKGNSKKNKANVELQGQTGNKGQKWTIKYIRKSKGYAIVNTRSKKVLAVKALKNGANVIQVKNKKVDNDYKLPKKQVWAITATKDGFKITSKAKKSLVLNINGGNINIKKNGASRFWLFDSTKWSAGCVVKNGIYNLRPYSESSKVLSLSAPKRSKIGYNLQGLAAGNLQESFQVTHVSGNQYEIAAVSTGRALTAKADGTVYQAAWSATPNQKWSAKVSPYGGIIFTNVSYGKVLDASGTDIAANAAATLGDEAGVKAYDAQRWQLAPTTTNLTGVELRGLSKANDYGYHSADNKKEETKYFLAIDMAAHKLMVFTNDDPDTELWARTGEWTISTPGSKRKQYKLLKKKPYYRTTGATLYTNSLRVHPDYSAYYWTHLGNGSWLHSQLYRPGTKSMKDSRLGYSISGGCIRNPIKKAQWIQKHITEHTAYSAYIK